MLTQQQVIAANIIRGVDPEWQDFLYDLIERANEHDINIDFSKACYPLPKQLKNSSVVKEYNDGCREYISSSIWLAIDKQGNRTIIEPKETSGVLIDGETGCIIRPFNHLPAVTPHGTEHLIRILIRRETNQDTLESQPSMRWKLYTNNFS